jgi:murein DD-endopeptidase MepM/ murein hydrolase activator NlpD
MRCFLKIKSIITFGILFFLFGLNLVFSNENDIPLTEIPSIWPIEGGLGSISMFFGENINPTTEQIFYHSGINITTSRSGDAVVATANGKVITAGYDYTYGNYIIIEHNHGFHTLYAHLSRFRVRVDQIVQQGEIIGFIGNTGFSTGPHLHYEIHVFSEVVNPLLYINNLRN